MSRARDMANLGAQAGSGFDASDLTTGTLGNTVQDNITRLGTVTTGTMNNTIGSSATFPGPPSSGTFSAGHILQVRAGTSTSNASGTGVVDAVSHTITMSSASNKLLVFAVMSFRLDSGTAGEKLGGYRLKTSGTGVTAQTYTQSSTDSDGAYGLRLDIQNSAGRLASLMPINYLFSPAYQGTVTCTASMMGYDTQYGTMQVNPTGGSNSSIILIEVVA